MPGSTRDEKVTAPQKKYLVYFMENHLDFARGKFLTVEGRIQCNSLWSLLVQELNNIGPEKTVQKWQRAWTQIKTKVKRKASTLSTNGKNPLSDLEEKIMFILSNEGAQDPLSPGSPGNEVFLPDIIPPPTPVAADVTTGRGNSRTKTESDVSDPVETDYDSINSTAASTTEEEIRKLANEVHDVKNVLNELLQEHRNTNSVLERIACALENKN